MDPAPGLESELLTGVYTDEEKAQILGQIEQAASSNRLTVDTDAFRPRKRGILFPVAVNVAAVVLIVGAWFGANAYFQTRQAGLQLKTDQLFSTESKLLAKVLQDSKNQLAAKEAELSKINGDLAKTAAEKADLQKSFASRVAEQDQALRQQMADALEAEKKRLQASGLSQADVTQRLADFENQKNAEFANQLSAYKTQVQAEIDRRAAAVTALQAQLQTTINDQAKLRAEVEKQTKDRESALQNQLSTQAADLTRLKQDRDDLNQYFRQTDTALAAVRTAMESGDWTKTQAAVSSLRQSLARSAASSSEAVRTRALAEGALAGSLDTAVSSLAASTPKAEASAQVEALKAQIKKDQAQAAQQLGEAQKALAESDARWKQAQAQVDALVAQLDDSTNQTLAARTENQTLRMQISSLERQVEDLAPYRTRAEDLAARFAAPYPTARDRFLTTFGSEAGQEAFPGFAAAWQEVESQMKASGTAAAARKQALDDVLNFTTYLAGTSPAAATARAEAGRLALTDDGYKTVIDSIQALATKGAAEAPVSTVRTQLYGTVASVSGTRVVLDPLTKARPQAGDAIELRRIQGKKETVLGRGTVQTASAQKVEVDWTGNSTVPLSGDAAYLVLSSPPGPDKVVP